ncbi:MAG: AbrB/MazE/SpoVT family DNA-binding domain-containing protein [Archaeoglobaceae archaeon]
MEARVRVTKKRTIYLPKEITEKLGIEEGSWLRLRVEKGKLVAEIIESPFALGLKGKKFAETTFEEFERESEKFQEEIFGENSS